MAISTSVPKPLSKFTPLWNGVAGALKKLLDSSSVPFVTVYQVDPRFDLPAGFDVAKYRGLAICHVAARMPNQGRLLAYWNSEEHYRAHGVRLETDLALMDRQSAGVLVDLQMPKERWWRHFSVKDWLISAAAVITALTLLKGTAGAIFERPGAQVVFADSTPIQVTSGVLVSAAVNITNDRSDAKTVITEIRGTAVSADRHTSVALASDQGYLPPLATGERKTITMGFVSPARRASKGPPELYDLTTRVTARSGFVWGTTAVESVAPRSLEVWPSGVGAGPPRIRAGAGAPGSTDRSAQIEVLLYPGKAFPSGIDVAIPVSAAPDEIASINANGNFSSLPPAVSPVMATHEILLHTNALDRFIPSPLIFILDSAKPLSPARWKQIVDSIVVNLP